MMDTNQWRNKKSNYFTSLQRCCGNFSTFFIIFSFWLLNVSQQRRVEDETSEISTHTRIHHQWLCAVSTIKNPTKQTKKEGGEKKTLMWNRSDWISSISLERKKISTTRNEMLLTSLGFLHSSALNGKMQWWIEMEIADWFDAGNSV